MLTKSVKEGKVKERMTLYCQKNPARYSPLKRKAREEKYEQDPNFQKTGNVDSNDDLFSSEEEEGDKEQVLQLQQLISKVHMAHPKIVNINHIERQKMN